MKNNIDIFRCIADDERLTSAYRFIVINNQSNYAPYHNLHHLLTVASFVREGCAYHGLDDSATFNLTIAALFHDFNHSQGERADFVNIDLALQGLKEWYHQNFDPKINIDLVISLIKSTEWPYVIKSEDLTLMQAILRDADLMHIYADDWYQTNIIGLAQEFDTSINERVCDNENFINQWRPVSQWGQHKLDSSHKLIQDRLNYLKRIHM